ncbi:hypothetical protein HBN50_14485 [Halobacteriovorax sp. GB3]|uniref:hypothetical protein n=1 Tax=Halobacteriovorax sp. GB3 TaxID=2719615 RepID=UPI00235E238B|nr:hypothetical protein [Halobacteriovorax sp. GB3]MDD0854316.1 hypothetical protein [Halobacteriovorax sp. GB3]
MKIMITSFSIFMAVSVYAATNSISDLTCGVHVQKKAGGQNTSVLLKGSEVKAKPFKKEKNTIVANYIGERFSYTVYAEKTTPSSSAPDLLISFKDIEQGVNIWSPQGRNAKGEYVISINERTKKEPIYYLKCKTE